MRANPTPVRYDEVNAMLLNEFLKEHHKVETLEATGANLVNCEGAGRSTRKGAYRIRCEQNRDASGREQTTRLRLGRETVAAQVAHASRVLASASSRSRTLL
jgi:hypothetical protein